MAGNGGDGGDERVEESVLDGKSVESDEGW